MQYTNEGTLYTRLDIIAATLTVAISFTLWPMQAILDVRNALKANSKGKNLNLLSHEGRQEYLNDINLAKCAIKVV
jgi:hypothetical protein